MILRELLQSEEICALFEQKLEVSVGEVYTLPYHGWQGGDSTKGGWSFKVSDKELHNNYAPKGLKVKVTKVTPSKVYFEVEEDFKVAKYKFNPFGRNARSGEKTGAMKYEKAKNFTWVVEREVSKS